MVIGQSGTSRQIEVTPWRLRIGIAGACAVLAAGVVAVVSAGGLLSGTSQRTEPDAELSGKIAGLQDELRKKEMQLVVKESRLKELQESSASLARHSAPADA